jgi:hypothetical protein
LIVKGDLGNVDCVKAVGAKALGYAMIAASFAIKAPQIAKVSALGPRVKSACGIAGAI